jgi:predicted nucleotidyltransferase component of viral defense system
MSILSENQRRILAALGNEPQIVKHFYLSGGTALAEYYLHHRRSEDLDFFSEQEFDPSALSAFFKKISANVGIQSVSYEQSFNRNLFFLSLADDQIKTEFTYFPFTRIERGVSVGNLAVDSLLDIAVNKMFTIYQKPRSRDFIDLYCIIQKEPRWTMDELMQKAQIKFDTYLDPIQLAGQYMKAEGLKDYPTVLTSLQKKEWQQFFTREAKRLGQAQIE